MSRIFELADASSALHYLGAELRKGKFVPDRKVPRHGRETDITGGIEASRKSLLHESGIGLMERAGLIALRYDIPEKFIVLPNDEWMGHPAVYDWPGSSPWNRRVVLFPWAKDDEMLRDVESSGVSARYMRAAWDLGQRRPEAVMDQWRAGIPEEYIVV